MQGLHKAKAAVKLLDADMHIWVACCLQEAQFLSNMKANTKKDMAFTHCLQGCKAKLDELAEPLPR